jgi:hypothetical protein
LRVCGFIPSHPPTFPRAWNVTIELHSHPTPLQALAFVVIPRLGLEQFAFRNLFQLIKMKLAFHITLDIVIQVNCQRKNQPLNIQISFYLWNKLLYVSFVTWQFFQFKKWKCNRANYGQHPSHLKNKNK